MFKFILISKDSQCIQLEYHRLTFKQRIKVFDCLNLESLDFFILKLMEIATTTKSDAYISNLYSVVRDENGNVKLDCPLGNSFLLFSTVVGSGPADLFASIVLAEFGDDVTLMERGNP
ncbi:putative FAD/NAD(P)-binding domain superfamily [Helianthus annuus]|nr:putative FAD/NAD(P)-binding domain superfamily [Helianthus annuus]